MPIAVSAKILKIIAHPIRVALMRTVLMRLMESHALVRAVIFRTQTAIVLIIMNVLIMLIIVDTLPTAEILRHHMPVIAPKE
jgi:hypothetical protein